MERRDTESREATLKAQVIQESRTSVNGEDLSGGQCRGQSEAGKERDWGSIGKIKQKPRCPAVQGG